MQELLLLQRRSTADRTDDQEQYHLLTLYQPIVACVVSQVPRVRQLVQDILQIIGNVLHTSKQV